MHFSDRSVLFVALHLLRCCAELYFGVIGVGHSMLQTWLAVGRQCCWVFSSESVVAQHI